MKNVKKFLTEAAKRDREAITNSESGKTILNKLLTTIEKDRQNQTLLAGQVNEFNAQIKTMVCPDCGSELIFKPVFGRFMHENCEQLNCWYAADEFGNCVDNNAMRAARIRNYPNKTFNDAKFD